VRAVKHLGKVINVMFVSWQLMFKMVLMFVDLMENLTQPVALVNVTRDGVELVVIFVFVHVLMVLEIMTLVLVVVLVNGLVPLAHHVHLFVRMEVCWTKNIVIASVMKLIQEQPAKVDHVNHKLLVTLV